MEFKKWNELLWVSLSLIIVLDARAQVEIGPEDMPQVGTSFLHAISVLPENSDISATGEEHYWHYSELSPTVNDLDTFIHVAQTPLAFQFFFNNGFLYPDYMASYAEPGEDLNLGFINISETFNYLKNDSEGFRNVGYGANINGIPASVRNIPVDWIYQFPMNYGNSHSSYSESEITLPTVGYFFRQLNREVEVEGWGTLSLPDGDYEVLKVKMVLNANDSVYVDALQTGLNFNTPQETVYQWLTPGGTQPILEIRQQVGFEAFVRYRYVQASSLDDLSKTQIEIFPNPSTDVLFINSENDALRILTLFDSSGRAVFRKQGLNSRQFELQVRNLRRGEYFLMIESDKGAFHSTFFKD